jgi:large subunit ribosomal protein L13
VIVINADKVRFTGRKMEAKQYITHSLYPGGQKVLSPRQMMEKSSTRIIEHAVRGMLPKNRLGSKLFASLHVFEGSEHPHTAQQPKKVTLTHL